MLTIGALMAGKSSSGASRAAFASGFALWRAAMQWQRLVDAALKPFELTHTQFLVLVATDASVKAIGDACTQQAIAVEAGLDKATTSNVVRGLSARGLLDRGPTVGDARAWRVIVTSRGRKALDAARPHVDAAEERFFAEQLH